jgi:NAD(P)-dependent dehydrogenase (short-subunit alcohol dehydrogenase family)
VLVTGGKRGIGAAVVRRFQLAGARVATTARSAPADPVDRRRVHCGRHWNRLRRRRYRQPTGAGSTSW